MAGQYDDAGVASDAPHPPDYLNGPAPGEKVRKKGCRTHVSAPYVLIDRIDQRANQSMVAV
jgi:hypothetical protein